MQNEPLPLGELPNTPENIALISAQSADKSLTELVQSGCVLLVDKASGWTSHDVVARTRRAFNTRKVGHAGTLDPLATGLLTLGIGPATRLLTHMVGLDKIYRATVRLGQQTVTDDSEGKIIATAAVSQLENLAADTERLTQVAAALTGQILQTPTAVSAIKVAGQRAYDLVRAGAEVNLRPREVTVHEFITEQPRKIFAATNTAVSQVSREFCALDFDCTVRVSSGTYVRALARDMGEMLGVYGHLTALRRLQVGAFAVVRALPLEQLEAQAQTVTAGKSASKAVLQPLSAAAVALQLFGAVVVDANTAVALGHGKQPVTDAADSSLAAALSQDGRLLALVEIKKQRMRVVTGFPQVQG